MRLKTARHAYHGLFEIMLQQHLQIPWTQSSWHATTNEHICLRAQHHLEMKEKRKQLYCQQTMSHYIYLNQHFSRGAFLMLKTAGLLFLTTARNNCQQRQVRDSRIQVISCDMQQKRTATDVISKTSIKELSCHTFQHTTIITQSPTNCIACREQWPSRKKLSHSTLRSTNNEF